MAYSFAKRTGTAFPIALILVVCDPTNKNSSGNNKDNNFIKDDKTTLDDEQHYKDDNLNYLININA